jgi:hypothetical protein
MSQKITLPKPNGLSKTTITIIITTLLSLLAVSLSFNILSYTSNPHPPLNVQIVNLNWTEYDVSTENNLYFVVVRTTLLNPDPRSAWVQILYVMYDSNGSITSESLPTYTTTGFAPQVSYMTCAGIGPNMTIICCFNFYYLKPQNTTTQLRAEIGAKIPIV